MNGNIRCPPHQPQKQTQTCPNPKLLLSVSLDLTYAEMNMRVITACNVHPQKLQGTAPPNIDLDITVVSSLLRALVFWLYFHLYFGIFDDNLFFRHTTKTTAEPIFCK